MVFGAKSSSKTKLFEQPLDKLFSPKAIKQFNEAISNTDNTSNSNNQQVTATVKSPLCNSISAPLSSLNTSFWAKLSSQDSSPTKRKRAAARLRRFTIDANNNAHILSSLASSTIASNPTSNGNTNSNNYLNQQQKQQQTHNQEQQQQQKNQLNREDELRRHHRQLMLGVLPEPIRCLLNELYLRGPSTVGIFRKSPNAKHCRELRQKLEASAIGQSSSQELIEQYQVNVIASVFKEWLRSLPDCLLMSRLYPQWIDVAKLIEPLHLDQQRQQVRSSLSSSSSTEDADADAEQQQQLPSSTANAINNSNTIKSTAALSDTTKLQLPPHSIQLATIVKTNDRCNGCTATTTTTTSLRPPIVRRQQQLQRQRLHHQVSEQSPTSLMTDNSHDDSHSHPMELTRARSCSIMTASSSTSSVNEEKAPINDENIDSAGAERYSSGTIQKAVRPLSMSEFALRERHSECIRIIRQLFDRLNEANLILLKAIISVLCHIANNSEQNKMSSTNLGVCVGQSLLNDEHQTSSSSSLSWGNNSNGHNYHNHHSKNRNSSNSNLSYRSSSSLLSPVSSNSNGSSPSSSTSSTYGGGGGGLLAFSAATFARRHRRSRSQSGQLSSALSLSSLTQLQSNGNHQNTNNSQLLRLESSSAQETAKYVPMLVAFMIDNAHQLFGRDVELLFNNNNNSDSSNKNNNNLTSTTTTAPAAEDVKEIVVEPMQQLEQRKQPEQQPKQQQQLHLHQVQPLDVTDSGSVQAPPCFAQATSLIHIEYRKTTKPPRPVERSISGSESPSSSSSSSSSGAPISVGGGSDGEGGGHQQRPLSATESTTESTNSSSRASSSTSGLHSESPAFSSEPDSSSSTTSSQHHHQRRQEFATSSMPKIPFQYTTSCYGGESILYYPSYAHLAQQQHQQQQQRQAVYFNNNNNNAKQRPASYHPDCHRSQSLLMTTNRHPSLDQQQQPQMQPQRSHVMLLRDYYLALQQRQQQQQQQWATYRLRNQQRPIGGQHQPAALHHHHQMQQQQSQTQHLICDLNHSGDSAEDEVESDDYESWMESTMV